MSLNRWHYFLNLERDFLRTLEYVEYDSRNAKSFSNEYAKILLLAGSEVDIVAKLVCRKYASSQKAVNIEDYRKAIVSTFKDVHTVSINISRYSVALQPWSSWDLAISKAPDWWHAYNSVKHDRENFFPDANQEHTIQSLCGLFVLLLYLFKDEEHLQPYPKLFEYGFPEFLVTRGGRKLPGT